jgi:hypothetical protein
LLRFYRFALSIGFIIFRYHFSCVVSFVIASPRRSSSLFSDTSSHLVSFPSAATIIRDEYDNESEHAGGSASTFSFIVLFITTKRWSHTARHAVTVAICPSQFVLCICFLLALDIFQALRSVKSRLCVVVL